MNIEKIEKAYVTRCALTSGVEVVSGYINHSVSSNMLIYRSWSAHGKDWHRTPEAAMKRAEEMRMKKIASLEKQIAKLKIMRFEIKEQT